MILIKDVEVEEVDGYASEIASYPPLPETLTDASPLPITPGTYTTEFVKGKRYLNYATGTDVVIGMAKKVYDSIGIPLKAFESAEKELEKTQQELVNARRKVNEIQEILVTVRAACVQMGEWNLWQRLRWACSREKNR